MLLEPFSRFFLRHHVTFRTPYDHGQPLSLQSDDELDVIDVLRTAIDRNRAEYVLKGNDVVRLTKVDVRTRQNIVVLLFRRSDPEAATPIFEHQQTKRLRASDKQPNEAVAVSAHLFIKMARIGDMPYPSYHAILEEVPGLSRTYIQLLLKDILKDAKYNYADRRGEEKETYALVEFQGVPSERVGGALRGDSVVPFVTLVRPGDIHGLDTEGLVVARDQRMKLVLRARPDQTLRVLRNIQAWMEHHNWPKLLVEMDMPENRTRRIELTRQADAADVLFVRSVLVNVGNRLEACTAEINDDLARAARDLFAADDRPPGE
jgi:hypothetical protein